MLKMHAGGRAPQSIKLINGIKCWWFRVENGAALKCGATDHNGCGTSSDHDRLEQVRESDPPQQFDMGAIGDPHPPGLLHRDRVRSGSAGDVGRTACRWLS